MDEMQQRCEQIATELNWLSTQLQRCGAPASVKSKIDDAINVMPYLSNHLTQKAAD